MAQRAQRKVSSTDRGFPITTRAFSFEMTRGFSENQKGTKLRASDDHVGAGSWTSDSNKASTKGLSATDQGVTNAKVYNCDIGIGDGYISITFGTSNVDIRNIKCGPRHSISIGSLGYNREKATVEKIRVKDVMFDGTENGARIKSWQGDFRYARQITFSDIKVNNVGYPIIIDHNYCDSSKICKMQKSAVQIQNVTYQNIRETSTQEQAVKFVCSKSVSCKEIARDVDMKSVVSPRTKSM